ncbi:MAG: hypothetical protein ACKO2A_06830, partial [Acidimicrobiaceae bacterium]
MPTGVALYLLSNSGRNKLRNILKPTWLYVAISFVAVTVLMVYLRQLNLDWWIRSWDVVYHESKSFSIAKFGPNENISLSGYSMNYHWFGNAWIGMNSVVNRLPPWLSIAQVSPVFSALLIAAIINAINKRISNQMIQALAALTVYIFATGGLSTANPP